MRLSKEVEAALSRLTIYAEHGGLGDEAYTLRLPIDAALEAAPDPEEVALLRAEHEAGLRVSRNADVLEDVDLDWLAAHDDVIAWQEADK